MLLCSVGLISPSMPRYSDSSSPSADRVGCLAIEFSQLMLGQDDYLAIFDILIGVKYRIRQICPIPPLPGRPLLFIWTLGCVRCGVIGLLLVAKKLLIVGLASLDQSGADSCLLEAGYTGRATPPYLLTWVKITQETLLFYRIMYKSMGFFAVNSVQAPGIDFIACTHTRC